jgi:carboxypeptidase Taq
VGFDLSRGRIDSSAHPFCMGIHNDDVRITWRASEHDFRPGLFGLLHEMGHALYEQGLPLELRDTPLGGAASVAVHESQSRLWENHVGRSHGFCRWLLPHLKGALPGAAVRSAHELQLSLLEVRPSLIRVDADELTYHLHIVVRFRLERALIAAELEVDDLPGAWNDAYRETLGIEPSGDLDGVLQDIHWACGLFGYFPTYTLGSLIAAQLFEAAERELGALDDAFAAGDFSALLGWLRSRVHAHGARLTAAQLVAHATGSALSIAPLLSRARVLAGSPAII